MGTPATFPISTASFRADTYIFDPLYAYDTISQSANIAGGLGVLKRGTVLFGPIGPAPITNSTLLTTVPTGASARVILAQDIDTTGGQVTGLVYTQGRFLDTAMTFSSNGAASDCSALWDYGVYVLTVLQRSGTLVPMMKLPATGGPLPQAMSAKDAKQATEDEVKAIKSAVAAYQPGPVPAVTVPPAHTQPAWVEAAFGPAKPTATEQAEEKGAEQSGDLQAKQQEAYDKLVTEQQKALSDLLKKQQEERDKLAKQTQDAISKAEQQDAQPQHHDGQQQHSGQQPHTPPPPPPPKNQK